MRAKYVNSGIAWKKLFLGLLLYNTIFLGVVMFVVVCWDPMDTLTMKRFLRWPLETDEPQLATYFATWDGAHFLNLYSFGYYSGNASCAFYPLWPTFIHWAEKALPGFPVVAGLVLNMLFSSAGWTLFYQLTLKRFGASVAWYSALALICFPGALFFHFLYSASLFFLLVMGLWWGLERRHPVAAFVCAFMAPLTRGVGLFLSAPVLWHWVLVRRWEWLNRIRWPQLWITARDQALEKSKTSEVIISKYSTLDRWLPLAPLLGWGSYLAMMAWWTGNYWEGVEAQKYWGAHSISHLWDFPMFVEALFNPTNWHQFHGSLLDRCVFIILFYALILLWRQGKDLVLWGYCLGVLPAMSGMFVSFTRFAAVCFPLFIALGIVVNGIDNRGTRYLVLAAMAALQVALTWRFIRFEWAG